MPDTLHLVLTRRWFEEIKSGRKLVEYRNPTPFWQKRIWDKRNLFKTVIFHCGYTNETIQCNIAGIDMGPCEYPEWPGEYIRIHLALPATRD